ncbi:MAG: RNA methyltransferase [Pyrinomonadaceae bacterium]
MMETTKITSRENERLKFIRKVRDGKSAGRIFIEGVRQAEEALRSEIFIEESFISAKFAGTERKSKLVEDLRLRDHSVTEVAENLFSSISDTQNSQGIIIIARRPDNLKAKIEANLFNLPLVVFLHEVGDPSNLGGILRTAEAAGTAGVVVSKGSADAFSPKAVRAAMGSSFRVPVWESADFNEVLLWAKRLKLKTTSADINAEVTYIDIDWQIPRLLIFGSEAHGLSRVMLEKMEESVCIPMANEVESLNLAISCGIILFEAKRQNYFKVTPL